MPGHRRQAIERFAQWARGRFGTRLRELTLFGSEARGQAHENSDVDVALVVDELTTKEASELDGVTGDLLTEFDVLITPFALSTSRAEELRRRERLIMKEITCDGVPL